MRCHLLAEGKSHGEEWPLYIARFSQPGVIISLQICLNSNLKTIKIMQTISVLLVACTNHSTSLIKL